MDIRKAALELHSKLKGKISVLPKIAIRDRGDLSLVYTPGVAEPCREIAVDRELAYSYTMKGNCIAVVSDGSAVLGLGDIGPEAALPVMEGKCVLFRQLAGIDAFPLCLAAHDADSIVSTVKAIAPVFGAINLEDIAAPKCFEVEKRLLDIGIPVMHDDQHGTAVVVLAGLINALKVTGKDKKCRIVINGAGAAGIATARLLLKYGFYDLALADSQGAIYKGRPGLTPEKKDMAELTNRRGIKGSIHELAEGADVLIGLSRPATITAADIRKMNSPIVFAMANPIPEIMPDEAREGGAAVIGSGRSDFPNQINNSLTFPGIFRGALDVRALAINDAMKIAAAEAIAGLVTKPTAQMVVPEPLDPGIVPAVAEAVRKAARDTGVAK
ncbi:NADP-dependent malic enzyme [Candidatus Woesearchaeota archaeon]|nr:NADP-dependent malic enzyme [Candidatus Woesearchaeota archaeon]